MKKIKILIGFFLMGACHSQSYEELSFVGYKDRTAVFVSEEDNLFVLEGHDIKEYETDLLYKFPNKSIGFSSILDDKKLYAFFGLREFDIVIETKAKMYKYNIPHDAHGGDTDLIRMIDYYSEENNIDVDLNLNMPIWQYDIRKETNQKLPIKGVDLKVVNNHLYYTFFPDEEQYDLMYDIYKVPIGQWDSPELVFKSHFDEAILVSPDERYILVQIIENGYSPKWALYSTEHKKFNYIDEKYNSENVFYSYQKETFCFYQSSGGNIIFDYLEIPDQFLNTPSWAMDFGDSFIAPYLLDEADRDVLSLLDREQLRLLRNAIFARRGWKFKSKDLQQFFGQFEWYVYESSRYDSNGDIELTADDKWRSHLIKKIEDEK